MNNKISKKIKRILSMMLISIILISSIEPAITIWADEETIICKENYTFEYKVVGEWDKHVNVMVNITNTGNTVIDNWAIKYDIDGEIENIWNAVLYDKLEDSSIIKNAGWNQDINVGETVSFGYILCTENHNTPSEVELISSESIVSINSYETTYNVTNSWETGCIAELYIKNIGESIIEDWIIEFDYENEITSVSGGVIVEKNNNHYVIKNPSYNQNINQGDSAYIQILANLGNVKTEINNVVLRQVTTEKIYVEENYGVELNKTQFIYDEETGYYYISESFCEFTGKIYAYDEVETATIKITNAIGKMVLERNIDIKSNFVVPNAGLLLGDNSITVTVVYKDGSICTEQILVVNYCEENMTNLDIDSSDNDCDGLINFVEEMYGTNSEESDTDGDGLSDYEELVVLGYDPNKEDSDENEVLDADEDIDNDGISNVDEVLYGTDNCTVDTDGDGLTDYEEVVVYYTNPNMKDSDGDGADDDWEISNGFEANEYDDSFILSHSYIGRSTAIDVLAEVKGDYVNTMTVSAYKEDSLINSTIAGYIGDSYNINIEGGLIKATIKFEFESDCLQRENFNPTVYYFNESEQILEEVKTCWDGSSNYVIAELEHFSTYCVLDKSAYEEIINEDIKDSSENIEIVENYNIVFVLDTSSSMWTTKSSLAQSAIATFISTLDENDDVALVTFSDASDIRFYFGSDKEEIQEKLNSTIYIGMGKTSIYEGLETAITLIENNSNNNRNVIILLTDGKDEPETTFDSHYKNIVYDAIFSNTSIYSIGIDNVNDELLGLLAAYTDGMFYKINSANEFLAKMNMIRYQEMINLHDKNEDGIIDEYMERVCKGDFRYLTESKGDFLFDFELFQESDDFDGDGLKNGEEIKVKERNGNIYVRYYSNPSSEDTDGDGFSDYEEYQNETDPLAFTVSKKEIDYLFENNNFLSAYFTNEYKTDTNLQAKVLGGNMVGNLKLNCINDFKEALLTLYQIYVETTFEDKQIEYILDITNDEVSDFLSASYDIISTFAEIADETGKTYDIVIELEQINNEINVLAQELARYNDLKNIVGIQGKIALYMQRTNTMLTSAEWQQISLENGLDNSKLTGKLTESVGKFSSKLPSGVKASLRKISKSSKYVSYALVVVDNCSELFETINLYSAINVGAEQYVEFYEILNYISENSEIEELRLAADELKMAFQDEVYQFISESGMISNDVGEFLIDIAFINVVANSKSPIVWSVGLGWTVGNLINNTGELNEELIYVLTYSEAASISYFSKDNFDSERPNYYEINNENRRKLKLLCQLRIFGEDKYAYASSRRGYLIKLIAALCGESQSDVEKFCKDNIDKIYLFGNKCNMKLYKKYSNSYLYTES